MHVHIQHWANGWLLYSISCNISYQSDTTCILSIVSGCIDRISMSISMTETVLIWNEIEKPWIMQLVKTHVLMICADEFILLAMSKKCANVRYVAGSQTISLCMCCIHMLWFWYWYSEFKICSIGTLSSTHFWYDSFDMETNIHIPHTRMLLIRINCMQMAACFLRQIWDSKFDNLNLFPHKIWITSSVIHILMLANGYDR